MDRKFCIDVMTPILLIQMCHNTVLPLTNSATVILNHVIKNLPDGDKYYFPRSSGWMDLIRDLYAFLSYPLYPHFLCEAKFRNKIKITSWVIIIIGLMDNYLRTFGFYTYLILRQRRYSNYNTVIDLLLRCLWWRVWCSRSL